MGRRTIRIVVVVLLFATAAIAWRMLRDIDRQHDGLASEADAIAARLDRIAESLHGIGAAQLTYVAPGQPGGASFERVSTLLRDYQEDIMAVGPALQSPDAAAGLETLSAASESLMAADARARANLGLGQSLMASDLVVSDARSALDTMLVTVAALKAAEREHHRGQSAIFSQERWSILAVVAGVWALGLAVVTFTPVRRPAVSPVAAQSGAAEPAPAGDVTIRGAEPSAKADAVPKVDLTAAADLCVSLSRLSSAAALPGLLSRAATVLDASGVILWMAAGEELFAAAAHGYKPNVLARLGPIPRSAANATAATWREGRRTVVRGDRHEPGAMVVPMFGPESCIGVLSVELEAGREQDGVAQAVASMVAAQLATAVAAWPAASRDMPGRQDTRERRSAGA